MAEFTRLRFPDIEAGAYVPVGQLLRRARDLAGLNQQDAAAAIGINASTLSAIEAGRRPVKSIAMAIRLADGLRIPRAQLVDWIIREIEFHAGKKT